MSQVGVHSFQIPHHAVRPVRDMVILRIPMPPSKIGSILTPEISRDIAQHNVMAGLIMAKGPIAFGYKAADENGNDTFRFMEANVGDWCLIRPFAGTMMVGGQMQANFGYRYVSSFQDVIGVIAAKDMPHPDTLEWDISAPKPDGTPAAPKHDPFAAGVRERVVYKGPY
jgi:hypothetical protein